MHGPEDLFDSVENDAITGLPALVICGEAAVIGWMPIFGRDDEIEASLQSICKRHNLIAVRHGYSAAGQKVIVNVDENQRVHFVWRAQSNSSGLRTKIVRGRPYRDMGQSVSRS